MPGKSSLTRFFYLSFFFVLVLFSLIPDGEGNSSRTSSVPGKSSSSHTGLDLHWPANYVSDANGPSPASICSNTCWSANNNTRWPAHSVFLCPSWPNHATVRKSGLYIDFFLWWWLCWVTQSVSLKIELSYFIWKITLQFRIFNGQLFANSYDYITGVGRGWGCCWGPCDPSLFGQIAMI